MSRSCWLCQQSNDYMNVRYLQGELADTSSDPNVVAGREALANLELRLRSHRLPPSEPGRCAQDMLDVLLAARKTDGAPLSDVEVRDNVSRCSSGAGDHAVSDHLGFRLALRKPRQAGEDAHGDRSGAGGPRSQTFQDLARLETPKWG